MNREEEEFARLDPKTLDPNVAKVIFATQWDEAIDFFRAAATSAGLSYEEWLAMLEEDKAILERLVPLPHPLTVAKAKPFVELSDMLTLARVARYCFENVDKMSLDMDQ